MKNFYTIAQKPFFFALTGILLFLSFPKVSWSFLVWIAFVPLLYCLFDRDKLSLAYIFITGLFYFGICYWISIFGWHAWFALVIFQSVFLMLFVGIVIFLREKVPEKLFFLVPPFAWITAEWLRGQGPLGFPWGSLAYSQSHYTALIQISSITGIYGLSFLIMLVNTFIALMLYQKKFNKNYALAIILIFVFLLGWGSYLTEWESKSLETEKKKKVAVIQGSFDQDVKWDLAYFNLNIDTYHNLTKQASLRQPYLVVWPETAVPANLLRIPWLLERFKNLARETNCYLAIGCQTTETNEQIKNTMILISPAGEITYRYDKVRLVPFAEYLPCRERLGKYKVFDRVQNYSAGKERIIFKAGEMKFGVLICFESIFPAFYRELSSQGAESFAIVTNDAWFKRTSAPYQHSETAIFRAVENRAYIMRAANTGISCFIDPYGRIMKKTALYERTFITEDIGLTSRPTFYKKFGDLVIYVGLLFMLFYGVRWQKKGKPKNV